MSTNIFIAQLGIEPADAIVLRKKFFGMLDHYVIYLGIQGYEHKFVANYVDGVKLIPNDKIDSLLQEYIPSKVEKFPGPNNERPAAIKRAISKIDERMYNIISNNCEHFKNYVHNGIETSSQVQKVGGALAVGGLGITLIGIGKKNNTAVIWGIIVLIIGILIATFTKRKSNQVTPYSTKVNGNKILSR